MADETRGDKGSRGLRPVDLGEVRTALEAEGAPWRMGSTSMTVLDEQTRVVRLGVPLPDQQEITAMLSSAAVQSAPRSGIADGGIGAPAAFDARNVGGQNYTTPIKNQGNCGSCVAFGAVATAETTYAYTGGQPSAKLDLSEAHLFYGHGPATGASCANGWWPEHAFNAFRDQGVTTEDYFPYTSGNTGGATVNPDWPNRKATAIGHRSMAGNAAAIKEHISTKGAVSACLIVYQDFFSYTTGVYRHVTGGQAGGHCVSLIGYDDTQRCWIGKNSWGPGWGEAGFFRIAYGDSAIDTWDVRGMDGLTMRWWNRGRKVVGVYTNASPRNGWAYLSDTGWRRLVSTSDASNLAMLTQLSAAKATGRPVDVFEDAGAVSESYVF